MRENLAEIAHGFEAQTRMKRDDGRSIKIVQEAKKSVKKMTKREYFSLAMTKVYALPALLVILPDVYRINKNSLDCEFFSLSLPVDVIK